MALNLKVLHNVIRGYRSKARSSKYNSGIDKRISLLEEERPDIENIHFDEQTLDNLESGISDVSSCGEYRQREERKINGIIEYKKIERKFFKAECYPNLLSWSEKEQIRFLYNSDPVTWSPDKLSECFPATVNIIKKLIKSQWKPMSSDRIICHDKSVYDNWKAIETGRVKLPIFFEDHIKRFISRTKSVTLMKSNNLMADKSLEEVHDSNSTNASSEFLNIIKNYKGENCVHHHHRGDRSLHGARLKPSHMNESYVLNLTDNVSLKHKYYTLPHLRKELMLSTSKDDMNETSNKAMKCESEVKSKFINFKNLIPQVSHNHSSKEHAVSSIEHPEIPLKIRVPKEEMAKSKTRVYKVKECYYDCHGEFLYKVPGMS